jgi:hypothetical protein
MAKMNSAANKHDGEVRLWVDGQLVTEMTGVILRNASHRDIQGTTGCSARVTARALREKTRRRGHPGSNGAGSTASWWPRDTLGQP